jgi:hypothetical protein
MSYKWSKGNPRTSHIVDSAQFNEGHDNYKGALNGNLNRDNLPAGCISRTNLANNWAHKVSVTSFTSGGGYTTAGWGFGGATYDELPAGWNPLANTTMEFKEGMLHIELGGIISIYKDWDHLGAKMVDFKITYNGMDVCFSPQYSQSIMPVYAVADTVVAEGSADIRIFYRITPARGEDLENKPWFYFTGGSLLLINRYR